MHPQRHRPVLKLISKRKLHLIPVSAGLRARQNPFKFIGSADTVKKTPHLLFLYFQLLLIRDRLINASAAGSKMDARLFRSLQR